MNLEITARNYQPTKRVREAAEKRADKFTKYFTDLNKVRFTLEAEKLEMICEVHVYVRGKDFHSKAGSEDMLAAVDRCTTSMETQLRRFKRRLTDHKSGFRQPGTSSVAAAEEIEDNEVEVGPEEEGES